MRLIRFEVRKHLGGKLLWCVLALLLLLNMVFCARFTDTQTDEIVLSAMKTADEIYFEDPEGVLDRYTVYEKMMHEYEQTLNAWMTDFDSRLDENGIPSDPPTAPEIPSTYYEGWNDYELFHAYFSHHLSQDEYQSKIEEGLDTATQTLLHYRANHYDASSYAYRYQLRYLEVYSRVSEQVQISGGYDFGWDILFTYNGTGMFIFLAVIFIGSRLFLVEKDSGMQLLLRTARYGRERQVSAKIVSAVFLSLILTVAFFASTMLVIEWKVGFSSPMASVQQISKMLYCPYSLTMLTCLLLTIAFTVLVSVAICLCTACFSLLMRRSIFAMLSMAGIVGLSYYFSNYTQLHFLKSVNLFTASSGCLLFERWTAVHVFSHPVNQLVPLAGITVLLLLIAVLLEFYIWSEVGVGTFARKSRFLPSLNRIAESVPYFRFHSLSQVFYEIQKTFLPKTTLLLVVLIVLKILLSMTSIDGVLTYRDESKLRYLEEYEHMTLSEAAHAVNERLAHYVQISDSAYINEITAKRIKGEISYAEYQAFCNDLSEATAYMDTLTVFEDELQYLIEKEAETGITAKPVFSIGMRVLFESDFEWILVILFLLLFSGSYAREYESNFMPLLRSTRRGRSRVFHTKAALVIGISVLLSLSFILLDTALVFARYDMSCTTAPLFAISTYRNTASGLTVGDYLVGLAVLRTLSYTLFGVLIAALSGTLCSEWSAAGVTLLCFIPYVLKGIGLDGFEPFDFTLALSGDRLYLYSTALGNTGSLWFLCIFVLAWVAVTAVLITASYRKFCK